MNVATAAWTESVDEAIARLRARLDPIDAAGRLAPTGGPLAPAGVLAPLIVRDGALWFVLTERAAGLPRHSGQISFPGGRPDSGDADLAATALREAREEIGLAAAAVELLGGFDPYETITGYAITPFVGLIRGDFTPTPDPREVASVFEAPYAFLMDPANRRSASRLAGGATRWFYEMPYGAHYIWGATAGLLKSLSDRLYGEAS